VPSEQSKLVQAAMKKICADFSSHVTKYGFEKSGRRMWKREINGHLERIHFHRHGSSYGAPTTNSVDIRVELMSQLVGEDEALPTHFQNSDQIRKSDGYCYHHRFNAKTGHTYERCLEELIMYTEDFAEPWFRKKRGDNLLKNIYRRLFKSNPN